MSKKAVIGIGAGCLGCIGIPALLAVGGAAGWLLANQSRAEAELSELRLDSAYDAAESDDGWREEERSTRFRSSDDVVAVKPIEKAKPEIFAAPIETATPAARLSVTTPAPTPKEEWGNGGVMWPSAQPTATPVAKKLEKLAELAEPTNVFAPAPVAKKLETKPVVTSTPAPAALSSAASAPKATPTPSVALKPVATPAPVKKIAAPLPKSTPRKFDDGDELFAKPAAKPTKVASAAPAAAATSEDDIAVAALFGDEPGSAVKPAPAKTASAAAAPAATPAPKVKSFKTDKGTVQATIDRQIVVQTRDGKTLMGTLSKVESGWVGVKLSDGKVKFVQESEIVEASEL